MSNLVEQLNSDLAGAVDRVRQALVEIRNGRGGAGAGTIWSSDGLVLTNAHVVGRHGLHVLLPDGRDVPARVVGYDRNLDVAALEVEANGLPVVALGDSRQIKPGEWVMALGHPWGVTGAVTSGVVIGSGAHLPDVPADREWVVVSLHMRPGHSGGALVDGQGRLVGINTMITGPDVGVAVPAHVAAEFVGRLERKRPSQSKGQRAAEYV
jgi:S1-C subfamily serine protease